MIRKTKKLYQGLGWPSLFTQIRFITAPYKKLESLIPKKGLIVDLGCGYGIFCNFLGMAGRQRTILGLELDEKKIKYADRGVKNVQFQKADIIKSNFKKADVILLIHVLHHLNSFQEQKRLLEQCQSKLKKDGQLIIAEVVKKPTLKYWLGCLADRLLYSGDKIYYRFEKDLVTLVKKTGFSTCQTIKAHHGNPFATMIYVAKL